MKRPEVIFDRDHEWAGLATFANGDRSRIALVYGRRRQGKSFLLRTLVSAAGGFYHQALEEEREPSLISFGQAVMEFTDAPAWTSPRFEDWQAAFRALAEKAAGRLIVIDDFPNLTRKSPELRSVIQTAYDASQSGEHPSFALILCGSALSVMSGLLTGQRALRGRAAIDMLIGPFDFRLSREFWGIEDLETALYVNAVLGGPPGYKDLLAGRFPQDMADFEEWLFTGILDPSHALFREADFLLAEDPKLADRAMYQSMVSAIATGASTRNGLAAALGRQKTDLEHQLRQLEQSQMVIRDTNLLHANRPLLRIADPLLRFHHAITRPDLARFENRRTAEAWNDAVPSFGSRVLGPHFESLARAWTWKYASASTVGGQARRVGFGKVDPKAAGQAFELDVVVEGAAATRGRKGRILAIGEAKASARPLSVSDLERLIRLRDEIPERANAREARLLLFGRSGFDDGLRYEAERRSDVELIDLERLYRGD